MGRLFLKYLDGPSVYVCSNCNSHLCMNDEIISKHFHGRYGKAYLFNKAVNVSTGPLEERHLMTGLHVVCDIYCVNCKSNVGWKYKKAYATTEQYKIGKFCLEMSKLKKENM